MTTLMTMEHTGKDVTTTDLPNYSRRWWILAVLGIAQLMVVLDGTIVNIALPTAQQDLRFSNADRQWIVTAYSLAFGSLLLLGGRIGDMVGRKRPSSPEESGIRGPGLPVRFARRRCFPRCPSGMIDDFGSGTGGDVKVDAGCAAGGSAGAR